MNLFQKYLVEEFAEEYQEGRLTRCQALKLISGITGSLLLANTILAGCAPPGEPTSTTSPASTPSPGASPTAGTSPTVEISPRAESSPQAEVSPPLSAPPAYGTVGQDDPAISAGEVQFAGEGATLLGYLAHPRRDEPRPVVLVCHENRGLVEHIQDVTRRLARTGYVALAVDLLSRLGGTPAVGSDQVPGTLGNVPPEQFVQDFLNGWRYLGEQPFVQAERVGMIGFCFGGGVTWLVATRMPELKAAVPFYGPHPPVEEVANIRAAVLAIYAGRDQRINQGIPTIEQAMQQNQKIYEKVIYPDADHAFHNDTISR